MFFISFSPDFEQFGEQNGTYRHITGALPQFYSLIQAVQLAVSSLNSQFEFHEWFIVYYINLLHEIIIFLSLFALTIVFQNEKSIYRTVRKLRVAVQR